MSFVIVPTVPFEPNSIRKDKEERKREREGRVVPFLANFFGGIYLF